DNSSTLVRFVPNAGYSGTVSAGLTFRAWDQTSGTNGGTADASNNGASTPFSSTTASASILVDVAPTVVGSFVSGSAWSASYLSMLDSAGLGSSAAADQGFQLADGASQLTTMLPWTNITQLSIAFSEGVTLSQASLSLYNSANTLIPTSGFSYNSTANIATWQFSTALAANKYVINLAASSVTDAIGTQLDGAWTTGFSTFAAGSGDGTPGGDFNFYFDVLPGDANSSGAVTNSDVLITKLQVGAVSNSSNFQRDVNASGNITNGDVLLEKLQVGSNINSFPTPQLPPQSAGAPSGHTATPAADPTDAEPTDAGQTITVVLISPAPGFVVPALSPQATGPLPTDPPGEDDDGDGDGDGDDSESLVSTAGTPGDTPSAGAQPSGAPAVATASSAAVSIPVVQSASSLAGQPADAGNVSTLTVSIASTTMAAPATISSNALLSSPTASLVVLAIPLSTGPSVPAPAADVLFELSPDLSDATSAAEVEGDSVPLLGALVVASTGPTLTPAVSIANLAAPASRASTLSPAGSYVPALLVLLDEAHATRSAFGADSGFPRDIEQDDSEAAAPALTDAALTADFSKFQT
ncbi:MAG TPA: hypothetical protein VIK18_01080, partial [Pirellulales bacterium]